MALSRKSQIPENSKMSDLSVKEFRALMHEIVSDIVQQAVFELEQQLPDPDEGKVIKPKLAEQLRQSLQEEGELISAEDIIKELGLDG
jgi:hypothetical protein